MKTTFLNQLLIVMAAAVVPVITSAQSATDTIAVRELGEIVVRAPKVIRKADMDVYHPSKSAVANSRNGMQLLSNLMIPSLTVSCLLYTSDAADERSPV